MKLKVTEWGNSHGIRITSAMMEHLNIDAGDNIQMNFTDKGVEIVKNNQSLSYLEEVKASLLESIYAQSAPVVPVDDPYKEADIAYIVIAINPSSPEIRQVPKDTENAFYTLADAKEAARQYIQTSINEAEKSLSELRQVGIANISYISL